MSSDRPVVVTLSVTITQFRTLGGVFPTSATYAVISAPPNVKIIGGNILIKASQPVTVIFKLSNAAFVFVGATFAAPGQPGDVGITEFPAIAIDRTPAGNSLAITDLNRPENLNKPYNYVLFLQNIATGDIGMIDPIMVNEN